MIMRFRRLSFRKLEYIKYWLINLGISIILLPSAAFAQDATEEVKKAENWAKGILTSPGVRALGITLATLMLVIGGYRYITSQGNPQALGEAKAIIYSALAGLALLLLGGLIFNTIVNTLK